MDAIEYTFLDRSTWPQGPWMAEPDKAQWEDFETALPCLAVRHKTFGNWCGYVGVTEGHPLFGKNPDREDGPGLNVHGGVTFTDFCTPGEEEHGICHVPGPGEPDRVWWLGFDCAHLGDYSPLMRQQLDKMMGFERDTGEVYRTLAYVKNECADLARQLMELSHGR
jgi:hypothetical protein